MLASEAPHVVLSTTRIVHKDMLFVSVAEFLNGLLNVSVKDRRIGLAEY